MRWVSLLLVVACAAPPTHVERLADAPAPVPELPEDTTEDYARGAELYRTAACVGCHSPPFADAEHLGGGRDLPTIFGVFYAPNISPHRERGIGQWTEADFVRAMREGRSPEGRAYWPTFPYMTYTRMTDDDLHALWVYLSAADPVNVRSKPHEVRAPYGMPGMLGLWRTLAFRKGPLEEEPTQSAVWHRGRYLVRAVSYCDQCHTPRSSLGLVRKKHDMAGGANPGKADVHPNLTSHPQAGIGSWTPLEIAAYLETSIKPDGSKTEADNIMAEKIHDSFAFYDDEDRMAIAAYLMSLPPNDFDPEEWGMVKRTRKRLE